MTAAKKKPAAKKAVKPVAKKVAAKKAPAKPTTPAKPRRADWEAVERDYRAGKLTLREMAQKHGCTNGRIAQVAKERGWTRGDLKKAISEATTALLVEKDVQGEISRVKQALSNDVLAAAELNKQVILRHRTDLDAARSVAMEMLGELAMTTHGADEIEALFEKVSEDTKATELEAARQKFRDFMRLHSRVGSVHKLADAIKKLQEQERVAFGLDDAGKKPPEDDAANLSDDELDARIEQHLSRRQG